MDEKLGPTINATNPDLKGFKDSGGKLILYHGWSDSAIAPTATVNYFQAVISKMGQKSAADFVRLYMVPGMQHCGNGPGPNVFGSVPTANADPHQGMQAAIERWVTQGIPPDAIIAPMNLSGYFPISAYDYRQMKALTQALRFAVLICVALLVAALPPRRYWSRVRVACATLVHRRGS